MLNWILVGVFVLNDGAVLKVNDRYFKTMDECFHAREETNARLVEAGAPEDKLGWQTLCIKVERQVY